MNLSIFSTGFENWLNVIEAWIDVDAKMPTQVPVPVTRCKVPTQVPVSVADVSGMRQPESVKSVKRV